MLHIISVKDNASQTVLIEVSSSFFIFFNMETKFKQNIIQRNGIKNTPILRANANTLSIPLILFNYNTILPINKASPPIVETHQLVQLNKDLNM